jgi:uncharacterized coiled-coil DUF342 family protein
MDVNDILQELNSLRGIIQEAKQERGELTGKLSEQMKSLKKHGVETIKDAKDRITYLKKEIGRLEKAITTDFIKLKKEYDW